VTRKVVDSEPPKRHEKEIFEFGVASSMFVPPTTLVVTNSISLVYGLPRIMREGYQVFDVDVKTQQQAHMQNGYAI
jgi:hypothetical protein